MMSNLTGINIMEQRVDGTMQRHDIRDRADVALLVRSFYTRAFTDEVLGPIFIDVAKMDLDAHMPIMCDFWENILFQSGAYRGGMGAVHFQLHMKTPLRMMHFQRWLDYWETTVDELFVGERANIAKMHAGRVAGSFGLRFEQLSQQADVIGG